MIYFIYFVSYFYIIYLLVSLSRNKQFTAIDKMLLFIIALIPLGKLIYFPVINSPGLKFSFIVTSFFSIIFFLYSLKKGMKEKLLLPMALILPAIISMPFLHDISMLIYWQVNEDQSDSILLRLLTFVILIAFSIWCASFTINKDDKYNSIATYYSNSLLFAVFVGILISSQVFLGKISAEELLPISADTHILEGVNFYRFNPGANVNEFGMLLGYGIVFVLRLNWSWKRKIFYLILFLFAEFATLTRAAWIGVSIGLFFYMMMEKKYRVKGIILVSLFIVSIGILSQVDDTINYLVTSRSSIALDGGSESERLEKYEFVFDGITESGIRFLVGYGWSTNMYVHSVPLQLLYETGIIGLLFYSSSCLFFIYKFYKIVPKGVDKRILLTLFCMSIIFSLVHHTLYHMQTWLIIGLLWGTYLRHYDKNMKLLV